MKRPANGSPARAFKKNIRVSELSPHAQFDHLIKALTNKQESIAKALLKKFPNGYRNLIRPRDVTPLHLACHHNFKDIVEICIGYADDLNHKEYLGRTPLFFAKDAAVARLLLENGARADVQDEYGRTPLHRCKDLEVARLLLACGARVDTKDNAGRTPLHRCKDIDQARLLLKNGAPVDVKDKQGLRPLIHVLSNQWGPTDVRMCLELIDEHGIKPDPFEQYYIIKAWMDGPFDEGGFQELLKHGINAQAKTIGGQTAIHFAAERGNVELVSSLKRFGIDANARDGEGRTVLHTLFRDRHKANLCPWISRYWDRVAENERIDGEVYEDLKFLLEHDPDIDVNSQDNEFETPLHAAMDRDYFRSAKLLLLHGANPNSRNYFGETPLMLCHSSNPRQKSCVRSLLDHGTDIFTSLTTGVTVFKRANVILQKILVEYLVEGDRLTDRVDKNGNTALHLICQSFDADVVKNLPFQSLDLNVANYSGETPLLGASKARRLATLETLLESEFSDVRSKNGLTDLHIASFKKAINESRFLDNILDHLQQGFDINIKDKLGKTPLHYAIESRSERKVRLLLERGADANAADSTGQNSLYRAIVANRESILNLILKSKGVDARALLFDGSTPLHLASSLDQQQTIELLIRHGLDLNILDANGNTPLFVAMFEASLAPYLGPDSDRIDMLLVHGASLDALYWIDNNIASRVQDPPFNESDLVELAINSRYLAIRVDKIDLPQEEEFLETFYRDCASELDIMLEAWEMNDVVKDCEEEVKRLKKCCIFGGATYYEFLHDDDPFIAKAMKDADRNFSSIPIEFPQYGDLILGKIRMDLFRNDLIPLASNQLYSYLSRSPLLSEFDLPPEIARLIVIHLSKNDLFILIGSDKHRAHMIPPLHDRETWDA